MAGRSKAAALPFMGVSEGFDLVKKVWGVTGLPMLPTPSSMAQFATRLPQTLPSMIAPTLDVEELDKRIADLRAVEQWLNLNLSMLRTTVQSLEVQRNTIATLKSFGGAMLAAAPAQAPAASVPPANWPYPAGQPLPPMPAAQPVPAAAAPPAPLRKGRGRRETAAAAASALPLNPAAWWNTLQEQFTKIAATAAAEAQSAAKAAAEEASNEKKANEKKARGAAPKAAPRKRKRRAPQRG